MNMLLTELAKRFYPMKTAGKYERADFVNGAVRKCSTISTITAS